MFGPKIGTDNLVDPTPDNLIVIFCCVYPLLRMIVQNRIPKNRITNLLIIFLLGWSGIVFAQPRQVANWTLLESPGRLVKANAQKKTVDGWTHFYNDETNVLLMSIRLGNQDIGSLDNELSISTGLLANYGSAANDMSGASYISNSIWLTMNRYWRIEKANRISEPVRVRFYYSKRDYDDLVLGLEEIGLEIKQTGELVFYSLLGAKAHPFSIRPEALRAQFVSFKDSSQAIVTPWHSDLYYAEFELETLDASGSGGFLVPIQNEAHSISGTIKRPDGNPIPNVTFPSSIAGAQVRSDDAGEFVIANLEPGRPYTLNPGFSEVQKSKVTVLDLITLQKRLDAGKYFEDPYKELAGDMDGSSSVNEEDLNLIREQILTGNMINPGQFRFIPAEQEFREGRSPFYPGPAQSLEVPNLISDRDGADFIAVEYGDISSELEFPNEPPILLDAGFVLSEEESCGTGEIIEVDLSVLGFDGVHGFQFSIQWDPTVLEFLDVLDYKLPNFDEQCLGLESIRQGKLSVAWYTTKLSRQTRLPDGSSIAKLKFKVLGSDNSSSIIQFVENPTPIQVLRKNLSPANILFRSGSVQVSWKTAVDAFNALVEDVSCFSDTDGSINISIRGNKGPYTYAWSNGATTEDLRNLSPGEYVVTVTGSDKCPLVSDTLRVEEPRVLFLHNENVRQIHCPDGNDGAISFKTSGGTAPYTFTWSNGSATPWIGQLGPGDYSVTVTDGKGCSATKEFYLEDPPPLLINYGISPASDPLASDGAISIHDLLGSSAPQQFEWSTGDIGPVARNLSPGNYQVTVTDAAFCSFQLNYKIGVDPNEQTFEANLRGSSFAAGALEILHTSSPQDQTVQLKFYDSKSRMIMQKVVPLLRGQNQMHFTIPDDHGSYLMQLHSQDGSVTSLRFRVE